MNKKNPAAVALGKLARGHKKTGLTDAEKRRRSEQAKKNLEQIFRNRELARLISANEIRASHN